MPARRIKRYVAYNAALWVAVALIGVLVLTGVRQYGHTVMARQTVRHFLDAARKAADRGGLYEAQRSLREALAVYPPISPEIAAEFGGSLTGMPLVREEMLRLDEKGAAPLGEAGRLTLALAHGGSSTDLAPVRPAPGLGELNLSLGRNELVRGALPGAAECFRTYWAGQDVRRAETAARLLSKNPGNGGDEYSAGKRMIFNGLLPEALAAFDRARAVGYENADMVFWRGAAAELGGQRDEARAGYAEALKRLPNHRLALLRMKALEKQQGES